MQYLSGGDEHPKAKQLPIGQPSYNPSNSSHNACDCGDQCFGDSIILVEPRQRRSAFERPSLLITKGPFTISVYADQDEGKTSVLRLAKELVEKNKPDTVTAWFNNYQYSKEHHPITPLLATIAKSVNEKLKLLYLSCDELLDSWRCPRKSSLPQSDIAYIRP